MNTRLKFFQSHAFNSRGERDMVDYIISNINNDDVTIYSYKNMQFFKRDKEQDSIYFYDLVLITPKTKLCIEYHGTYWHCWPGKYAHDFVITQTNKTATEVWELDKRKQKVLEDDGFKYFIIWEHDWLQQKELLLENIKQCLI